MTALTNPEPAQLPATKVEEMTAMARQVVASNMFPQIQNIEQAFTLMMICSAENRHPFAALKRYDIIKGKATTKPQALLADFKKLGGKYKFLVWDHECCEIHFDNHGIEATVKWTIADAKRAQLSFKPESNWSKYPRNMLFHRCVADGMRLVAPEVIQGDYIADEVESMESFVGGTPSPPKVEKLDTEEQKKQLKKLRGKLNQGLLKCEDAEIARGFCKQFQVENGDIWSWLTGHREEETFQSLAEQHLDRIEDIEKRKSPEAIAEWITQLRESATEKDFEHFERAFEVQSYLNRNADCQAAINEVGQRLGVASYLDQEERPWDFELTLNDAKQDVQNADSGEALNSLEKSLTSHNWSASEQLELSAAIEEKRKEFF